MFNAVYIHLGAIRVIWASVVFNQDQPKLQFSVKNEQSDVDSSTTWYKNSVTLSLFVLAG